MRANGLDNRKWCGFKASVTNESRSERPSVCLPDAFSMMALSMAVMTGATSAPAVAAAVRSAPTLSPRFLVFHSAAGDFRASVVEGAEGVVVDDEAGEAMTWSLLTRGRGAPGSAAVLIAS